MIGIPDRIAIDADGFGWRVWNDLDAWSMVPVTRSNDPIPQPVTWFVPVPSREDVEAEAVWAAIGTNGFDRLMELVRPEDAREAIACVTGVVRAAAAALLEWMSSDDGDPT